METTAPTIDAAVAEFCKLRGYSPFRFSGRWFVARRGDTFRAFRTKKAAVNYATTDGGSSELWTIRL